MATLYGDNAHSKDSDWSKVINPLTCYVDPTAGVYFAGGAIVEGKITELYVKSIHDLIAAEDTFTAANYGYAFTGDITDIDTYAKLDDGDVIE